MSYARNLRTRISRPRSNSAPQKENWGSSVPGMGAVATTLIAGVEAVRKGIAKLIGSLTQMGTIRLGKRTIPYAPHPRFRSFLLLAKAG